MVYDSSCKSWFFLLYVNVSMESGLICIVINLSDVSNEYKTWGLTL